MTVCKNCNHKFTPKTHGVRALYCSKQCKRDYLKSHKITLLRVRKKCKVCGSYFYVAKCLKNIECCSKKCGYELRKLKHNIKIKCQYCSKEFELKSWKKNQRCCSKKCASLLKQKNNRVKLKCDICGNEYFVIKSRVKKYKHQFCSYDCLYKAQSNGMVKINSSGRMGYRVDLNDGNYYRSALEADYVRYLRFLHIDYIYEPKTFEFDNNGKIKCYTPDFYLPKLKYYVELKGYNKGKNNSAWAIELNKTQRCDLIYGKDFYKILKGYGTAIANIEGLSYKKTKHLVISNADLLDIKSIKEKKYKGQVIDIEVEDDHNFYVSDNNVFVLTHNSKMPDIDTDFQKSQRGKVLSYMKKYGDDSVIQIGSYNGLTLKSALKDILRMNNIPYAEANFVSENIEDPKVKEKYAKYFEVAEKLNGNIRHLSKHAAGVIITDKPVWEYVPVVYNSAIKDVVTGIDGDTLTSKKFLKVDILGLKALDMINDTLEYIVKYEGKQVDIFNLDLNDENILAMYRTLDVNNIFQFDTYLMKKLLPEVAPNKFKHLVELNAINRPAPLEAGMGNLYIQRRFGAKYHTPKLLEKHLDKTFGLLIYQEQVISILADLLDISAGQADIYRKKLEDSSIKDILNEYNYYTKLYERYSKEDVEEAMNFIQNSAGYLFNKCLAGDTVVYKKFGGCKKSITIEQLYNKMIRKNKRIQLVSCDEKDNLVFNIVKGVYDQGKQEVFEIELDNGMKIQGTINHRFKTNKGWMTIKEIINTAGVELAYMDKVGVNYGKKFGTSWNKGKIKNDCDSIKRMGESRIGNTWALDKFGGAPHNKGKKKENYLPLQSTSNKMKNKKFSQEHKDSLSMSAKARNRKGNPGKRSKKYCERLRQRTLQLHRDGKFPKTMTQPHKRIIEAMRESNIWGGFNNEVVVGYHSIGIANVERKIAIFVDGDYWHASDWYMKKRNKVNYNIIQKKNLGQDKSANTYLKNRGWTVLRFWEHDINADVDEVIGKIRQVLYVGSV